MNRPHYGYTRAPRTTRTAADCKAARTVTSGEEPSR